MNDDATRDIIKTVIICVAIVAVVSHISNVAITQKAMDNGLVQTANGWERPAPRVVEKPR